MKKIRTDKKRMSLLLKIEILVIAVGIIAALAIPEILRRQAKTMAHRADDGAGPGGSFFRRVEMCAVWHLSREGRLARGESMYGLFASDFILPLATLKSIRMRQIKFYCKQGFFASFGGHDGFQKLGILPDSADKWGGTKQPTYTYTMGDATLLAEGSSTYPCPGDPPRQPVTETSFTVYAIDNQSCEIWSINNACRIEHIKDGVTNSFDCDQANAYLIDNNLTGHDDGEPEEYWYVDGDKKINDEPVDQAPKARNRPARGNALG